MKVTVYIIVDRCMTVMYGFHTLLQEPLLYLDGSTVFLYAGLRIAHKMKANVLTSRTKQ